MKRLILLLGTLALVAAPSAGAEPSIPRTSSR